MEEEDAEAAAYMVDRETSTPVTIEIIDRSWNFIRMELYQIDRWRPLLK